MLHAVGRVKAGAKVLVGTVDFTDDNGRTLAQGNATFIARADVRAGLDTVEVVDAGTGVIAVRAVTRMFPGPATAVRVHDVRL